MKKTDKPKLLTSLKSRFPRLDKKIDRSAKAIFDANDIVEESTVESYKRDCLTISTLAQSGALPSAIAKFFIGQLVDPPDCTVCGRDLSDRISAKGHALWVAAGKYAQAGSTELNHPGKGVSNEATRRDEEEYFKRRAAEILAKEDEFSDRIRRGDITSGQAARELRRWADTYFLGKPEERGVFETELMEVIRPVTPVAGPVRVASTPTHICSQCGAGFWTEVDLLAHEAGHRAAPPPPHAIPYARPVPPYARPVPPYARPVPPYARPVLPLYAIPVAPPAAPSPPPGPAPSFSCNVCGVSFRTEPERDKHMRDNHVQCRIEITNLKTENVAKVGEAIEFRAVVQGGQPPYTYTWYFGDGIPAFDTHESEQTHSYSIPNDYTAILRVTDVDGKTGRATATLRILPGPTPVPAQFGSISGRVTDATTGNPVPGAHVELAISETTGLRVVHSTYTTGNGRYSIKQIEPNTYTVIASKPFAPPSVERPEPGKPSMSLEFKEARADVVITAGTDTKQDFALEKRSGLGAVAAAGAPGAKALTYPVRHPIVTGKALAYPVAHPVKSAKAIAKAAPTSMEVARVMGTKFTTSAYRDVRHVLVGKAKEMYDNFNKEMVAEEGRLSKELETAQKSWQESAKRVSELLAAAGKDTAANDVASAAAMAGGPEAMAFESVASRAKASGKGVRGAESAIEGMKEEFDLAKKAKENLEKIKDRPNEIFKERIEKVLTGLVKKEVALARRKWKLTAEDETDLTNIAAGDITSIVEYYTAALEKGAASWIGKQIQKIGYTSFSWGLATNGDRVRSTTGYLLTEWWGLFAFGILYAAGLAPFHWIAFIIWAFMKIPLFTGVAVAWIQIAFMVSGTILFFFPLPGYIPATQGSTNVIMLAIIGGLGNWLMNMKTRVNVGSLFEGTPFGLLVEHLTHFVAGGMIVLAVEMLMLALGFTIPTFFTITAFLGIVVVMQLIVGQSGMGMEWMPLVMILSATGVGLFGGLTGAFSGLDFALFLIFMMLGMTNFYPAGGMRTVSTICLVVLVVGYFGMGPYSAYVHETVSQIKQPLATAWKMMGESFTGVWLLLTNPTEYYARQQLMTARTETPLSWPQGIEITSFDSVPEGTVPADQEFAVFMLAENKGSFKATNVRVFAWCKPGITKCDDGFNLTADDYTKLEKLETPALNALYDKIKAAYDYSPQDFARGFAKRWSFKFTAHGRVEANRQAEITYDKLVAYVEYIANTSTSLQTEIASQDEIDRRAATGVTPLYRQVPAISKVTPAQISLNVGPQPLEAGKSAQLIVSIANTRPDGTVLLTDDSVITLRLSPIAGTKLQCPSNDIIKTTYPDSESARIKFTFKEGRSVIRPYEFKDIFAMLCNFTATDIAGSHTGLITAILTDYKFGIMREKSIVVGPPLGVYVPQRTSGVMSSPTVQT